MFFATIRKVKYTLIGMDNKEYHITLPTNHISVVKIKEAARLKFHQFMKEVINEEIEYMKTTEETVTERRRKKKDWFTRYRAYHRKQKLFQNSKKPICVD